MRYIKSFQNDAAIQTAVDNKELGHPYVALNESAGTIDWDGKIDSYSSMYFTIEARASGTFYIRKGGVSYSKNDGAWTSVPSKTNLSLTSGDVLRFKSTGDVTSLFTGITMSFDAYGNIESLEYGDDFVGKTTIKTANNAFYQLFYNSTGLRNAENLVLPATTLADGCYYNMFRDCTSLTTAPELPATPLADGCYRDMFRGCTSLATAPELPATTLAVACYSQMFYGCTSLTTAPELPATTLASNCYVRMFYGCTSLTTAPELPAPALAQSCYAEFFRGCSRLNYIKCLATNLSAVGSPLSSWVSGVAETGTFVKEASMTGWGTGVSGIPEGWTVVNAQ